jgi:hypothetical protein
MQILIPLTDSVTTCTCLLPARVNGCDLSDGVADIVTRHTVLDLTFPAGGQQPAE